MVNNNFPVFYVYPITEQKQKSTTSKVAVHGNKFLVSFGRLGRLGRVRLHAKKRRSAWLT